MMSDDRTLENKPHTFTLLPEGTPLPDFNQITSVSVVPFNDKGEIVVALLETRGIDLAGGHTEDPDKNCDDTARRETHEEICVTLGALVPACVIESTMHKNGKPTYMVTMTGPVQSFETLTRAEGEVSYGRTTVMPEQFVAAYAGGLDKSLMRDIIEQATRTYKRAFSLT